MTIEEIAALIAKGEAITVEFKSDRDCLPDADVAAAVVGLANTEGGELFIGVEDDGSITGLHPKHDSIRGLAAMIANKTNPAIAVRVVSCTISAITIARVIVPKSRHLVSTSDGTILRRRVMMNGKPEAIPFYPHEFVQRQSALGLVDPSAFPVEQAALTDLDPLERQRLRDAIKRYGGDMGLLALSDMELDGALGLITGKAGYPFPTVAGLLLIGREDALRQHIPSHEVAFQVLEGTDVRANEFFRKPLLRTFEEVEQLFRARLSEQEIQVGLFRVPIPNFDKRAFREAFLNALIHRDYARLGTVYVRINDEGLSISNPGGFVEGVSLQNLLVTEPRPRNPLLADIVKRIGLAERTGRGIDRIFEGLVRFGRPLPDYSRSDATSVIVRMSDAEADEAFLEMVILLEERRGALPFDALMILSRLRDSRRVTLDALSTTIQKGEAEVRASVERLVEEGLIEAHGSGHSRDYTLGAKEYRRAGQKAAYVRQAGFDPIQNEQMVLKFIQAHGSIKRADVMELCRLNRDQAYKLLDTLKKEGSICQHGGKKASYYTL